MVRFVKKVWLASGKTGVVTIPADVKETLGIEIGDILEVNVSVIKKAEKKQESSRRIEKTEEKEKVTKFSLFGKKRKEKDRTGIRDNLF